MKSKKKRRMREACIRAIEDAPILAARLAPIYRFLDWEWYIEGGQGYRIPTRVDVENQIKRMVRSLQDRISGGERPRELYVATAGLEVFFVDSRELRVQFTKEFSYFPWESEDDDA